MEDNEAILLYGPSSTNMDLFYFTEFYSEDPIAYVLTNKEERIIVYDSEKGRAEKQSKVKNVKTVSELNNGAFKSLEFAVSKSLEGEGISKVMVPDYSSIGMACFLRKEGFDVNIKKALFNRKRSIKAEKEIASMVRVQRAVEYAVGEAFKIIKEAKAEGNFLTYNGTFLTSEYIKKVIGLRLMERNCACTGMIVSSGDDACDIHCPGTGPIEANKAIVLDIFPRSLETLYYADMARTVVKGKPSKELKKIYKAVKKAQQKALEKVRAGVSVSDINEGVKEFFLKEGYKNEIINGKPQGYFHGLGHGIGLALHESYNSPLEEGEVITIEPGLYYHGVGGVRIEDMIMVTRDGCRNLANMEKKFIL